MTGRVLTIGLGGLLAFHVVRMAKNAGATHVIDVRRRPGSRHHQDHAAATVERHCRAEGLAYHHCLPLAPPDELLDTWLTQKATWVQYREEYQLHLCHQEPREAVDALVGLVQSGGAPVPALLCSEENYERCHRRILAAWLQGRDSSIEVVHVRHPIETQPHQATLEEFF